MMKQNYFVYAGCYGPVSYTHLDVYKRQVLGRFPKEQQAVMEEAYRDAADAACMMIEEGADAAMNHYNRKHKENS